MCAPSLAVCRPSCRGAFSARSECVSLLASVSVCCARRLLLRCLVCSGVLAATRGRAGGGLVAGPSLPLPLILLAGGVFAVGGTGGVLLAHGAAGIVGCPTFVCLVWLVGLVGCLSVCYLYLWQAIGR